MFKQDSNRKTRLARRHKPMHARMCLCQHHPLNNEDHSLKAQFLPAQCIPLMIASSLPFKQVSFLSSQSNSLVLLFSSLNGVQEAGGNLATGCARGDRTVLESKGKTKKNKLRRVDENR